MKPEDEVPRYDNFEAMAHNVASDDEFREQLVSVLEDQVNNHGIETLLSIGDVYSEFREEYNNVVLDRLHDAAKAEFAEIQQELLAKDWTAEFDIEWQGQTWPIWVYPEHSPEGANDASAMGFSTLQDLQAWMIMEGIRS